MFEPLRSHLSSLPVPVDVFFRDDDTDVDLPELRRLLDAFGDRQVPVNIAAVPGTLTKQCVALLDNCASAEVHQHGWMHTNHEPDGRKCEFGRSRSFETQLMDLARGRQRMTELMGERWAPIFTPPWNRCTEDTCRALTQLGFRAISKDRGTPRCSNPRLREIPVAIDLFRWRPARQFKTAEEIGAELAGCLPSAQPIGFLLHHKVMDFGAFEMLDGLLDTLVASGKCRFHRMSAWIGAAQ